MASPGWKPKTQVTLSNSPKLAILAYCISSISMTVVNKYCVSGRVWNLSFLLILIQAVVCVVAIHLLEAGGAVKDLATVDLERVRRWLPITVLQVGMLYTSTRSLQYLSVPVYTIFKNLTIIVIAYGESLWFGGSVSTTALLAFGLMVLSSVIAAWSDIQAAISNDIPDVNAALELSTLNAGYFWMAVNVFCTAGFTLGMRKVIKRMNFKDWDTMYYNNLISIPIILICTLVLEDWSSQNLALNFPAENRNFVIMAMVYSGLAAILISYCSGWCIRVTSSTTYSMVGALNKLPIAISGLIFFDAPVTVGSVSAIALGFVSGIVYAWAKIRQTKIREKETTLPTMREEIEKRSG